MKMMRCTAHVAIRTGDRTEELWPGLDVDVDRVLTPATDTTPAFTIADALAGRDYVGEIPADAPVK